MKTFKSFNLVLFTVYCFAVLPHSVLVPNLSARVHCPSLEASLVKVSVIQGLIATKGLKAKDFFRNLRLCAEEKKKKKHYYILTPLVAIGAQKNRFFKKLSNLFEQIRI